MNIVDSFYEQRDRWVLWAPVFIGTGSGSYYALGHEPQLWAGILALTLSFMKLLSCYVKGKNWTLWLPLLLFVLGFNSAQLRTYFIDAELLTHKTHPMMISAKVMDVEALPKGEHRVVLNEIEYPNDVQEKMPETVRIKLKKGKHIVPQAGERISIKAVLMPLPSPTVPGAFDFQRFAYFKGYYATGYAISDAVTVEKRQEGFIFERLRQYLRANITENIKDADKAAITIAMLDGEEKDISEQTMDIVRKSGIAHLMAISGLQVALVTGFFFVLLRNAMASVPYLALHYPIKKIAAFAAMCGAVFYMLLIGDSVSAERSVIMTCIVMLAIMLDRDPFTLRLAAVAASLMLIVQPEILFGASFQLSFSAVVCLIAFYEATADKWGKVFEERSWYEKILRMLLAVTLTTVIATMAVAPFSLYHFSRTQLFPGLIANIVAVPLSSFITIPFAILASLLMPLGLEFLPLKICEWSVDLILRVATEVASWPYGTFYIHAFPSYILAAITLGGLWLCIWQGRVRYWGILPIVIGFAIIPFIAQPDILIADRGVLFAVRNEDGKLFISESRKQKFIKNSWVEKEAGGNIGYWQDADSPLSCDANACIYRYRGKIISFVTSYTALTEDCKTADVIISNLEIEPAQCSKPLLLDKKERKYKGAHSLFIRHDGEIKVKSVQSERGNRPWTLY